MLKLYLLDAVSYTYAPKGLLFLSMIQHVPEKSIAMTLYHAKSLSMMLNVLA